MQLIVRLDTVKKTSATPSKLGRSCDVPPHRRNAYKYLLKLVWCISKSMCQSEHNLSTRFMNTRIEAYTEKRTKKVIKRPFRTVTTMYKQENIQERSKFINWFHENECWNTHRAHSLVNISKSLAKAGKCTK